MNKEKSFLSRFWGHLTLVLRHKAKVFKFCFYAGIPFQGIVHDLSKFSFVEFFESVKYFTGVRSPIEKAKEEQGYSLAWLHHKGRNKHHYEYWRDFKGKEVINLLIPYKYSVEMACDMLAAGQVYMKDTWTPDYPLKYWNDKKDTQNINPVIKEFLTRVFEELSKGGYKGLKKENTLKIYKELIDKKRPF